MTETKTAPKVRFDDRVKTMPVYLWNKKPNCLIVPLPAPRNIKSILRTTEYLPVYPAWSRPTESGTTADHLKVKPIQGRFRGGANFFLQHKYK